MLIHKAIVRLDFEKAAFDVLDRPGSILRILDEAGEGYWSELTEGKGGRILGANYLSEGRETYRAIAIEPTNVNFTIESSKGFRIDHFERSDAAFRLFQLVDDLREFVKVSSFKRGGVRVHLLGNIGNGASGIMERFRRQISTALTNDIEEVTGKPTDYMLSFDGESQDGLKYHLHFGPYLPDQGTRHFERVADAIALANSSNFIVDFDQYEHGFALKTRTVQWAGPLCERVGRITRVLEKHIGDDRQ